MLGSIQSNGLHTDHIQLIPHARTAQYVAVNDASKNLAVAMADMAIFAQDLPAAAPTAAVRTTRPRWVVVDANWSARGLAAWLDAARAHGARVAFEPVSVEKAARLFPAPASSPASTSDSGGVYPTPLADLAAPNAAELAALHAAAARHGYLATGAWFAAVDAFGIPATGARDRFVRLAGLARTDAGVPQQLVQLLPYVPALAATLGPDGVLLAAVLPAGDPLLDDPAAAPYVLSRNHQVPAGGRLGIGGVYMRLWPPPDPVAAADVASVNGAGDTFLGVLVAGLAQGGRVQDLVDVAQRAAALTLRSREAVSEDLGRLRDEVARAAAGRPAAPLGTGSKAGWRERIAGPSVERTIQ